jgi:hypothetical protein
MSTKYPSPLLGYNNNVRHKGKVFHIQTEDSGVKYGHIITHLFMDGGRILKSVKTSYSEYVGSDRMSEVVREMMKQQHKAMFIALRDGKFDAIIDGTVDPSQSTQMLAPSMAPGPAAAGPRPGAASTSTMSFVPQPLAAPGTDSRAAAMTDPAASAAATSASRPGSGELKLDIEALERAASGSAAPSPAVRGSELPPPPANLFRDKTTTGKYRVTPPPPADHAAAAPAGARRASPAPPGKAGKSTDAPAANAERRYAPTRPASIFGQAKPQQGKSIFGEDVISDKSLDEVILSYLAEDLDTDTSKKRK